MKEEILKIAKKMKSKTTIRTELPTQKMIDWFDFSFNQEPEDNDELESDMWYSENRKSFFDDFCYELKDLNYIEIVDVYEKSKNAHY